LDNELKTLNKRSLNQLVSFDLDITLNVIIFPGENMTGRIEELFQVHSDYLTGCMCLSYLNF